MIVCGAQKPGDPAVRCSLPIGHPNNRHESELSGWPIETPAGCGAPHSDLDRNERCSRPAGHVGMHCSLLPRGGVTEWSARWSPELQLPPSLSVDLAQDAPRQFGIGDRVSAEGVITKIDPGPQSAPGNELYWVELSGQKGRPVGLLGHRLTLVPVTVCATRFPGREHDAEAYCRREPFHDGLHEDAEGWRWGDMPTQPAPDDAHAPAEPRCENVAKGFSGPVRCWGMEGHEGKHSTPTGSWT